MLFELDMLLLVPEREEVRGMDEGDGAGGWAGVRMMLGMEELDGSVVHLDFALGVLNLEWRCSEPSVMVLVTESIIFFPLTQLFRLSVESAMSDVM